MLLLDIPFVIILGVAGSCWGYVYLELKWVLIPQGSMCPKNNILWPQTVDGQNPALPIIRNIP